MYFLQCDLDAKDETRRTFGARIHGESDSLNLDYEAEFATQTGSSMGKEIDASMFAAQFGYRSKALPKNMRIWIGFDYASGDRSAEDNKDGTFDQLFPLGHAYLGYIDMVGRKNTLSYSQGVSLQATKRTTVTLALHQFRRARDTDALYNAGGAVAREPGNGLSRKVGNELDLSISHKYSDHVNLLFGLSHLRPDDFIEQTGASESIRFAYAQAVFTY
ncbi:alginate export family protein [Pelagicoccus mobilis]|uniref:Alginate export family protein n=1 Tax=Pelagicoccus mobilis TaxID=415221 RepID=A0A934RZH5_9BACT|nr:alginate export family protein [Pelagicoccus mobilis]